MNLSSVPLPAAFFHSILSHLALHPDGARSRDIYEPVANLMRLSPEQRTQRLPSGARLRYTHRIGWSINMLKNAGYLDALSSGGWRITNIGREILSQHPQGFDDQVRRRIVQDARASAGEDDLEELGRDGLVSLPTGTTSQTPEERIDIAMRELEEAVAGELLDRVLKVSPTFFEKMVLDLIHALGYGTSADDLQVVGGSGDGGIDGIIHLDKLGFEKVYIQAKRWQNSVGRPEIQAFFGALAGRRAKKGVFITASTFTREAREFGEQVSENIVLIDGKRLSSLMIEHAIGVSHYRTIRLPRVNEDYFDAE